MNYLQLVQAAMKRAGVREDAPTTLVGATGIVDDFKDFVADTYRRIQTTAHGTSWFFRQSLDQTFSLVADTESYASPAGIQEINWRTVTVYETAKVDEVPLEFIDYYQFRMDCNTRTVDNTRPVWVTVDPDDQIRLFPKPDKAYTFRFDGVLDVDELSADADIPILPDFAHWAIVWGAVMRYAKHHEDGAKYADAESEYRPIFDTLVGRQTPETRVIVGHMYGERRRDGRRH
jgi:hypothetical protein